MEQRIDEWTKNLNQDYFDRQFETPYRSTVKFCDWLEQMNIITVNSSSRILDVGTGKGANLYYMKRRFTNNSYVGIDINEDLVRDGNVILRAKGLENCSLEYADIYDLNINKYKGLFEGIISFQTLSWLPGYETALSELSKIDSRWLAISSLFYEGLVDCKIEVQEFSAPDQESFKTSFYNIYSLPKIKHFLSGLGFTKFSFVPFEIDIDLPRPGHTNMQTYTETLSNGKRLQLSGPVLMSWYFILASKG